MERTMKKELGIITLSDSVRVSDPCYDMNTWCAGTIENVLPGKYNCSMEVSDKGAWGDRVSSITAIHADYDADRLIYVLTRIDVGVDSGQCGIYDLDYFRDHCKSEEWYDRICNITLSKYLGGIADGKCLVSRSGYGDGSYVCYVARNAEGKIVGIWLDYGLNEDEDEDD